MSEFRLWKMVEAVLRRAKEREVQEVAARVS